MVMETQNEFNGIGYICRRGFLDNNEIFVLNRNLEQCIQNCLGEVDPKQVFYEDKSDSTSLKQIQHLEEYCDYFRELGNSKQFTSLAEECLGGPVDLINIQYFNKSPGKNAPTPPHQDGYYFMIKPQSAVTMWLSLCYADAENGAVRYLPQSHDSMRPHGRTETLGFSQGITDWSREDIEKEVQMTAVPGDLLAHHSLTIHSAGENRSDRDRKSIGFIYYRKDVVVDDDAHVAYQQKLADEMMEGGRL
jgi:phytanoyl-CoA hydroxylase